MNFASLEILAGYFESATRHASAAMCRWTNGQVALSLESLQTLRFDQVAPALGIEEQLLTMVVIETHGAAGGSLILTFEEEDGRRLAAALLGRSPAPAEDPWSPLEQSALMETGNIVASAYLSELSRLTECTLLPLPPYFLQDFGASVLEQAVMLQGLEGDEVLIGRTCFELNRLHLNWNLIFLPTADLLAAIEDSAHVSAE